jgi:hypothetical protein
MTQNSRNCLSCGAPLPPNRPKFCSHKHAMDWHNSRQDWMERRDRGKRNAIKKARYEADPEFWRNKAKAWREANPDAARLIAEQAKHRYWEKPWIKMIIAAKGRAAKRGLAFDLTHEWGEKRWTGFCELTGLPFAPRYEANSSIFSPSLDKIIPARGYIQTNCRFVLFGVNNLKHDGTDEEMYLVAKALISNISTDSQVN